jgi:hypothetical protein
MKILDLKEIIVQPSFEEKALVLLNQVGDDTVELR